MCERVWIWVCESVECGWARVCLSAWVSVSESVCVWVCVRVTVDVCYVCVRFVYIYMHVNHVNLCMASILFNAFHSMKFSSPYFCNSKKKKSEGPLLWISHVFTTHVSAPPWGHLRGTRHKCPLRVSPLCCSFSFSLSFLLQTAICSYFFTSIFKLKFLVWK